MQMPVIYSFFGIYMFIMYFCSAQGTGTLAALWQGTFVHLLISLQGQD